MGLPRTEDSWCQLKACAASSSDSMLLSGAKLFPTGIDSWDLAGQVAGATVKVPMERGVFEGFKTTVLIVAET